MTEELDPGERRIARKLEHFAETPFPSVVSPEQVVTRVASESRLKSSRTVVGTLLVVAVAVGISVGVVLRPDRGMPGTGGESMAPVLSATVSPTSDADLPDCRPDAFLAVMRTVVFDYEPVSSPHELLLRSDLVVIGRVTGAARVPNETRGFGTHLTVEVAEVVHGDRALVSDGQVVVAVLADVSKAADVRDFGGCDVFLFLAESDSESVGANLEAPRVFGAFAQGFWVRDGSSMSGVYASIDQSPAGWKGITTLEDLEASALRDAPIDSVGE